MKQNHHFVVPAAQFKLLKGESNLQLYQFGTHVARHLFCQTCGVQAFYSPRSNPGCFAVTLYCVDNYETALQVAWKDFDGQQWEQQI